MLIAQLCKPVISGDKEVITADTVAVAKGRTVRRHPYCKIAPFELLLMRKTLPCPYSPLMQSLLLQLISSTGKSRISLTPEIAYTVPMIIGNIANRRPAVRELGIWIKAGHLQVLITLTDEQMLKDNAHIYKIMSSRRR